MSDQLNKIEITINGAPKIGTTTIAWLLADFLQHSGFNVEVKSDDLDDEFLANQVDTILDRLEAIIEKKTLFVINDRHPTIEID